jgi:uncharacterized protein YndB with AHSA1/START domain
VSVRTGSSGSGAASISLVVRRVIAASPAFLFDAWTRPELLIQWWGPKGVTCPEAQVDLRAGGTLRIANRFPDGRVRWIHGTFERVEAPHLLVYSWQLDDAPVRVERVTVRFEPRGTGCEVIVVHERIADARTRDQHQAGWAACLDGLERLVATGGH